jgi:hypothetical protein
MKSQHGFESMGKFLKSGTSEQIPGVVRVDLSGGRGFRKKSVLVI